MTTIMLSAVWWGPVLGPNGMPALPGPVGTQRPGATPTTAAPTAQPSAPAAPSTSAAPSKPATPEPTDHIRGQVIVRFVAGADRDAVLQRAARASGVTNPQVQRELATGAHLVQVAGDAKAFSAALAADPGVVNAQVNGKVRRAATATDPRYPRQWSLHPVTDTSAGSINIGPAWDRSLGAGARVAVLDSGRTNHPDLVGAWLGGYDFIADAIDAADGNGRDGDPTDPGDYCLDTSEVSSWHGTHVAGIVGARRNNGIGVAGVAPTARIVPIRVLGRCQGSEADLIDAMVWAAGGKVPGMAPNPYPARVLNMSLGIEAGCYTEMGIAVRAVRNLGALPVVAAGNFSKDASTFSPGNCQGAFTVASNTRDAGRASYSNYGLAVNLAAPGGDGTSNPIVSTILADTYTNQGGYTYEGMSGTSMAAPHVAGVAALLLSLNPRLTLAQLEAILVESARRAPSCDGCGAGILDAAAAVARVPQLASAGVSGQALTLSGSGFTRVTEVWVGSKQASFTTVDDRRITATLPAGLAPGRHAVWVVTGGVRSGTVLVTVG
ncbi:S8 family serine peptidase [Propionibacteriaceae bacterium G1746]